MKKVRIAIYSILILFVLGFVLILAFRESILKKVIEKVIASEKTKHSLNIKINEASFVGLTTVQMNGISAVPDNRDTLIRIDHFKVSVAIFPLFLGHIKIDELITSNAVLNIINKNGERNFDFM